MAETIHRSRDEQQSDSFSRCHRDRYVVVLIEAAQA